MVGLSIVLESHNNNKKYHPQVINKATTVIIKPSPATSTRPSTTTFPAAGFLDRCFLCYQTLLPGRDIYMYKEAPSPPSAHTTSLQISSAFSDPRATTPRGDRAFCSVECRCRQIFMDEEETGISLHKKDNCSFATMKSPKHPFSSPSPSSSASGAASRNRKGTRNRANGFAY